MSFEQFLMLGNCVICLTICFRLMFIRRKSSYRFRLSLLSYLLILSSGWTAFRLIGGKYLYVDPAEVILNLFVCVSLLRSGGDLTRLTNIRFSRNK